MEKLDDIDRKLLRHLCMDSRIANKELASKTGISEVTVRARLNKLERKVGLRYIIELDPSLIAMPFRSIIAVKLRHRPDTEKIQALLSRSRVPQFAAVCEGSFNLVIYAASVSHVESMRWQYSVRAALEEELISWKPSHVLLERQGVFPLRKELLRSLPLPEPQPAILAALNDDSRAPLTKIAKSTNLELSTVQYHFKKMANSGLIRRFSAILQKPPRYHFIASFLTYVYGKRHQEMAENARKLVKEGEPFRPINLYPVVMESDGAYDAFQIACFDDLSAGYGSLAELERIYGGTLSMESAVMTEIIFGLPPFRSMNPDIAYDDTDWRQGRG